LFFRDERWQYLRVGPLEEHERRFLLEAAREEITNGEIPGPTL